MSSEQAPAMAKGRQPRPTGRALLRNSSLARYFTIYDGLAGLVLCGFLLFVLATFRDYGITLDEWVNQQSGQLVLKLYTTFGADRRALAFDDLYYYGPWYQVVVAWAGTHLPFAAFEVRHLVGGLTGVATATATWLLGRQALGATGGLISLIFLLSTGYFVGNAFNNPIDTPFMLVMTLSLVAINSYWRHSDRPAHGRAILIGMSVGLAFATRIGGMLFLLNLVIGQALLLILRSRGGQQGAGVGRILGRLIIDDLLIGITTFSTTYALWPWLWGDPLAHLSEAAVHFSHMPLEFQFPMFGLRLTTTDLPLWYVPANLAVRLPEAIVLGVLVLPFAFVVAYVTGRSGNEEAARLWDEDPPLVLIRLNVGLGWLLPILVVLLTRPTLYDGFRHLLFILPPLTVTAAGGWLLVYRYWPRLGLVIGVLVGISLTLAISTLWRLHPYEYVYFNRFVGGPRGAAGRFELDYWGASLQETVRQLVARLHGEEDGATIDYPRRFADCDPWHDLSPLFPSGWRIVENDAEIPEFAITWERDFCPQYDDKPIYVQVSRMGIVLATVRDLRTPLAPNAAK